MPQEQILPSCICGDPHCSVPFGYCHCLCGRPVKLAPKTDMAKGWIQGEPKLFVFPHRSKLKPHIEDATPFRIGGVYCRLIPLTQGQYAIVNQDKYVELMAWKWFAARSRHGNCFYAVRHVPVGVGKQATIYMHKQILGIASTTGPEGDHADADNSLDNRRENLRPANRGQQCGNQRKRSTNTSGFKGVSFHYQTGKWRATITAEGTQHSLGLHFTPEEAHVAYCRAARRYFGEFARFE